MEGSASTDGGFPRGNHSKVGLPRTKLLQCTHGPAAGAAPNSLTCPTAERDPGPSATQPPAPVTRHRPATHRRQDCGRSRRCCPRPRRCRRCRWCWRRQRRRPPAAAPQSHRPSSPHPRCVVCRRLETGRPPGSPCRRRPPPTRQRAPCMPTESWSGRGASVGGAGSAAALALRAGGGRRSCAQDSCARAQRRAPGGLQSAGAPQRAHLPALLVLRVVCLVPRPRDGALRDLRLSISTSGSFQGDIQTKCVPFTW